MEPGKLRNRINVEHKVASGSDGIGNSLWTWTILYRSVPAEVVSFGARENWVGEGEQSQTTHRVILRYLTPLDATMRVTFNGRVLNILGVSNDEQTHTSTTLDCKEDFSPDIPAVAA